MDDINTNLKNMFFIPCIDSNLCFNFMNMCIFSPLCIFKSKLNIQFLISFQIEMLINIDKSFKKSLKHLTSHVKLMLQHKQKL
jgi:hypothetical protein